MIGLFILSLLITSSVMRYRKQSKNILPSPVGTSIDPNNILSQSAISKHNIPSDCWIIIENKVYDVTNFLARHPGGGGLITPYCGSDGTQPFLTQGGRGSHSPEAFRLLGLIYVGDLNGKVTQQPDKNAIQTVPIRREDDDD